jgi:hypothetical protein
VELEPIAD